MESGQGLARPGETAHTKIEVNVATPERSQD